MNGKRSALERWSDELHAWAIPDDILERAPASPWGFPPALFRTHPGVHHDSPSHRRAREAVVPSGTVIDVGAGAGASSLPLAPEARHLTAIDESPQMLERFAEAATDASVAHREVLGRWPDVAGDAGTADVVVCHHVFYNVADLGPFVAALTRAAHRRVIVELTERHPLLTLNHLWLHFHGLERPQGPTVVDALEAVAELGLRVAHESWERPPRHRDAPRSEIVAFARRRLCLPADRDEEIDALLGDDPFSSPTRVATLWWDA